tara:strand:+ start:260 stop:457 length:198 start_codon:yes stop_codon:yes gene_type:complete
MNVESKLLNLLKANQVEFSLEALKRPQDRDTFEYGYLVGMVGGYEASINVLLNLLDEERNNDDDL